MTPRDQSEPPAPTEEEVRAEVKRLCPWAERAWIELRVTGWRLEARSDDGNVQVKAWGDTPAEALSRFRATFGRVAAASSVTREELGLRIYDFVSTAYGDGVLTGNECNEVADALLFKFDVQAKR